LHRIVIYNELRHVEGNVTIGDDVVDWEPSYLHRIVSYNELSRVEGSVITRDDDVIIVKNLKKDEDDKVKVVVKVEDDGLESVEDDATNITHD